ncbi:XRE family transcriptional regulator [Novosphingobium sp. PhB165]|uniref:XRE family transcriptional regulator n=1 Tax=Novosphingobium sp. PhB165 TaxID=2485105 RepID=UPI001FB3D5A9|nr:XRE family transcriptional regulator [Novosphingobium sp. PhB165]
MRAIAAALQVDPLDLLVDIDDPVFDIEDWAEPIMGNDRTDPEADRLAVLVAAAVRARRVADDTLTIAVLEEQYGIAPVILSRIENAHKPYDRWNDEVRGSLRRLFGVADDAALAAAVVAACARGELDAFLSLVANPQIRITKTRTRTAALRAELGGSPAVSAEAPAMRQAGASGARVLNASIGSSLETSVLERPVPVLDAATPPAFAPKAPESPAPAQPLGEDASVRLVPVFGSPLPDGLLARTPTGTFVEVPRSAGPNAYGLRIGRSTLGAGLPGRAVLVVDPDRFPSAGGLAVIEQDTGLRVIAITFDRQGHTLGFSLNPDFEVALDAFDPARIATVLSAMFE